MYSYPWDYNKLGRSSFVTFLPRLYANMADLEAGRTVSGLLAAESTTSPKLFEPPSKPGIERAIVVHEQQLNSSPSTSQHGGSERVSKQGPNTTKNEQLLAQIIEGYDWSERELSWLRQLKTDPQAGSRALALLEIRNKRRLLAARAEQGTYAVFVALHEEASLAHASRKPSWLWKGANGPMIPGLNGENDYTCGFHFRTLDVNAVRGYLAVKLTMLGSQSRQYLYSGIGPFWTPNKTTHQHSTSYAAYYTK